MRLHGHRVAVIGANTLGLAVVREVIAAGASVHVIDSSPRSLRRIEAELEVTTTIADVLQPGPRVASLIRAQAVLGGIDAVVAIAEDPAAGGGASSSGDGVQQAIEMSEAPSALAFAGAVARTHRDATERGAVLVASALMERPEEGPTTHCFAFATLTLDVAARPASRQYLDFGPRLITLAPEAARERVPARTAARRGSAAADWESEPERLVLPPELELDAEEVAATCVWLLAGHKLTAHLLASQAPPSLS